MQGFGNLKEKYERLCRFHRPEFKKLQLVQLVLAGPDPDFVGDDPGGNDVLRVYLFSMI
jgi:hypothetical protein